MIPGPAFALVAAALFGASTPFAKLLLGEVDPWLLAGLLYFGSALGLGIVLSTLSLYRRNFLFRLPRKDWFWLSFATIFGGIAGPMFLMYGLRLTPASNASLLLNLEGVMTSALAWLVFKEHFDRRIIVGMIFIVAGGVVLSIPSEGFVSSDFLGPSLILLACLSWGIDNNLTRKVSSSDALVLTFFKSLVAGITNLSLAVYIGIGFPNGFVVGSSMLLGFFGYGLSIVMFVLALRHLGASRAGAYFSMAPFIGSVVSLFLFPTSLSFGLLCAGVLMGVGVWLHLTENHGHEHTHNFLTHSHGHSHDEHHQHLHEEGLLPEEGHSHFHTHEPMTHSHRHFPDIHHRHSHVD